MNSYESKKDKKSYTRYTKTFSLLPHKNNFTINYVPLNKSNIVSINESRKMYCPNVKYSIVGSKTVWPDDVNFLEEFFNFEKVDKIINKRYMLTRKNEDKKFIVKSIVTDGYGCSIIYDVKPKVNIILENIKDPITKKIPKIFENYKEIIKVSQRTKCKSSKG